MYFNELIKNDICLRKSVLMTDGEFMHDSTRYNKLESLIDFISHLSLCQKTLASLTAVVEGRRTHVCA